MLQGQQLAPYIGFRDADRNPSAPLPIQQEITLLRDRKRHILNAGSFGTGKTEWLCQMMVMDSVLYPGNMILTGRKKLDWFKSSTLPVLLDAIPQELLLKHDKVNHRIVIRTQHKPSQIIYRQLDSSREAVNQIKSMNLGLFAPDQIEELAEEVFTAAIGRLRRQNTPRQSISTCNPAGHDWIWKRWIDNRGGKEYGFIESRMWTRDTPAPKRQEDVTFAVCDNPYLPWDYIADLLRNYPDNWLDRYVYCGWDNFEGLVYPEWNDKVHLIKPFKVPDWWNRYIVMDHGHRNPTAVGWFAVSGDGDVFLYDLHYKSGEWVQYHAEQIRMKNNISDTDIDSVIAWVADPSIFSEHTETTIADEYEDNGIFWEKANNDRPGGRNRVASYLSLDSKVKNQQFPAGKPKLFVFNTPEMRPFLEEIKGYHWADLSVRGRDKNMPERPKKKDDHAMDMLRYAINWLEDSEQPKPEREVPLWMLNRQKTRNSWMGV